MKSLILASLLALSAAFAVQGQSNPVPATNAPQQSLTNALATAGISSNALATVNAIANALIDTEPYIHNGGMLVEAGALKIGSSYGGFVDVQFPVNTNSWQATFGTVIGYISNQVYSATLNVTLGTTVNIPAVTNLPVVGTYIQPVYAFAESGPDYNFTRHQVGAQYMIGFKYLQPIGNWGLGVSYALGGESGLGSKTQEFSVFGSIPLK